MTSYDGAVEEEEEEHMFDEPTSALHHYPFLKENHLNDHDHDHPDSSCFSSPSTLSPTSSLSSDISHASLFGFESSDDDSVKNETICSNEEPNYYCTRRRCGRRATRNSNGRFPPPIPCIGMSGKPLVSLQKIRHDGRFILVEVMTPCQEFIHARRENGCLKMHFIRSESESESEGKEKSDDGRPWKNDGNVER